jgi:hypothetical protein
MLRKYLQKKISSICNIYNNVIQDPVLFGSFIELEAYIKLQYLKKSMTQGKPHNHSFLSKKTNREFIKELRDNSVKFEHAIL